MEEEPTIDWESSGLYVPIYGVTEVEQKFSGDMEETVAVSKPPPRLQLQREGESWPASPDHRTPESPVTDPLQGQHRTPESLVTAPFQDQLLFSKIRRQLSGDKVLPGLYVGNYRDSKDSVQLDRFNITHIVAIHDAARKLHSDKHYLCVMAADTPDQNLTQYFPLCNDFIHAARLRGGNVLIHCLAGMSRSVTVAVAYIMSVTSLNWKEALKVVRVGRSVANPNIGFQKQLQEFEMFKLVDERRRLKERFPSLALVASDEEECQVLLNSYQGLLLSKDLCEGKCALGEVCPTGLCRSPSKRVLRRKSSSTPPQSPRLLPPTPSTHSRSSTNLTSMGRQSGGGLSRRPRSGPGGLSSYSTSSAASLPPSCSSSRQDLSQAGVTSLPPSRSSSRHNLASSLSSSQSQGPSASSAATRRVAQSAPVTPMASPQHQPRRTPDS